MVTTVEPARGGATSLPLVSVVLPTHNRAHLLGRAIRSVLAQTHANLELIVVDDASKDGTQGLVATFKDPRLTYVRLEENRRAAAARNVGILRAKGPLVAFQDDDDVWFVDKLRRQVDALAGSPDATLCLCANLSITDDTVRRVGSQTALSQMDFLAGPLSGFGIIATPSWLVRKDALVEAGLFDEGIRSWDDWELALRLSRVGRFVYVDAPLFLHDRSQGGGMWNNERVFSSDMRLILAKHGALWDNHPARLAALHLILARSEAQFHSLTESRQWIRSALALRPVFPKAWALLCATYAGSNAVNASVRLTRWVRRVLEPVNARVRISS